MVPEPYDSGYGFMNVDLQQEQTQEPVDMNHLRDITDGDREIERELFSLFLSNAEECIEVLAQNCTDGENIKWRSAAHELKGSAASLGAFPMSRECHRAQVEFTSDVAEKKIMLEAIRASLKTVKEFLDKVH
jgi:HPt (histidine-containing phosphotransfer) domain-containing protein